MMARAIFVSHSWAAVRGSRALSTSTPVEKIEKLLTGWSVEITPSQAKKVADFSDVPGLEPGSSVSVTNLVGADSADTVALCARLVEDGMSPTAHVPARSFRNLAEAADFLARLEAVGVTEALVLAGGAPTPIGELAEAMDILEANILQRRGFKR